MPTKTGTVLLASQALAAGQSVDASELNMTNKDGARIFVKITNGSIAPSTAPIVQFFSGESTGVKRLLHSVTGSTVANDVSHPNCRYARPDMFANITITAGGTQGCTVEVVAQDVV